MFSLLERFLVGTMIDINAKTLTHGNSVLHIAAINKDMKIIKLLLDKRFLSYVFINIQNHEHKLPLWLAAEVGHTDICKILIEKGSATEIKKKVSNGRHMTSSSSSSLSTESSKVVNYANHSSLITTITKAVQKMGGNHIIYRDHVPLPINYENPGRLKDLYRNPLDDYIDIFGDDNPKTSPINNTTNNTTNITNNITTSITNIVSESIAIVVRLLLTVIESVNAWNIPSRLQQALSLNIFIVISISITIIIISWAMRYFISKKTRVKEKKE
jgi:hypothetical protein